MNSGGNRMNIRTQQMNQLQKHVPQDFQDRLVTHLRQMYPERLQNWDDDELREFCQEGTERARAFDVRTEYDISRFLEYRVFLGESFDRLGPPWLLAILYGDGSGTYKMDRLDECYRVRSHTR